MSVYSAINCSDILLLEHKSIMNTIIDDGISEFDRFDVVRGIVSFADELFKFVEEKDKGAS